MSEEELLTELRSGAINFDDRAMELINSYTQEKCREARIDEIRLLDHRGFMPIGGNDFKYDVYQSDLDKRIAQLNKSKGE